MIQNKIKGVVSISLLCFWIMPLYSCSNYLSKSNQIVKEHCTNPNGDTLVHNNRYYLYDKGKLIEAGKIQNGVKEGVWYVYGRNCALSGVYRYKNGKVAQILYLGNTEFRE